MRTWCAATPHFADFLARSGRYGRVDLVGDARAAQLLFEIQHDELRVPEELDDAPFTPLDADERTLVLARDVRREGQGTFRSRLLDAYGRRCAITGEHTEIVLDAAHIQPSAGPRSNHVQNASSSRRSSTPSPTRAT